MFKAAFPALLCATLPAMAQTDIPDLPPQIYTLDPSHSSVTFTVSHLGFSSYTAGFDTIAGMLELDIANPEAGEVSITIKAQSLDLPAPPDGFLADMLGRRYFDARRHPDITFVSDIITRTGPDTADIAGILTLRGVARPVTLSTAFNGGYDGWPFEPGPRIGFSATAGILRSDFGMEFGIPEPGTTFGVGDAVTIAIETEWTGPPRPK